jgi:phosphomannomutase
MNTAAALRAARQWIDQDPDPVTVEELTSLIQRVEADTDRQGTSDLEDRFAGRLAFGTAGLRGVVGAGPIRMNRVVVQQTAMGLARHLAQAATDPSLVIGNDGRKNSSSFATEAAEILAGNGVRTVVLPRALPTPVLAFAVRELAATASLMVTASHNPADDNGHTVFRGGRSRGSQIAPPEDTEIAAAIAAAARTPMTGWPPPTPTTRTS